MAQHLMRFALAMLVAACLVTLATADQPHERQLLAAQSFGSVETPKQPKTVARAEWGPKFPSTGNKKLLAAQSFGSVETPKQPKTVARAEWGPKFPSTGNKKLLAFLAPKTPQKPADISPSRFASKPGSSSNSAAEGDK